MKKASTNLAKPSLDKDLEKLVHVEAAARSTGGGVVTHGIALIFLGLSAVFAVVYSGVTADAAIVVFAALLGGYMALNIGANDVANNVGPAVGSRALTMVGALIIAAIFESAGALLAGGDVVATISKGIIDPSQVADTRTFVWAMMAALVSAALWVNLATVVGAPVSTTHAVVGGVMGAGIAAVGFQLVNWGPSVRSQRAGSSRRCSAASSPRGFSPSSRSTLSTNRTRSLPRGAGCRCWSRLWPARSPPTSRSKDSSASGNPTPSPCPHRRNRVRRGLGHRSATHPPPIRGHGKPQSVVA